MRIDILTIFPGIVEPYINESILHRGQKAGVLDMHVHDLRDWAQDKHRKVDNTPYGGGPGMVLRADVIARAITEIKKEKKEMSSRVILFSPAGETFTQETAERYQQNYDQLILIAGRYEGVDYRVHEHVADEIVSVGDYVLSGGELPALIVTEAVARIVPGVLGKEESIEQNRLGIGVPQYTRPETVEIAGEEYSVPEVLRSGDHAAIAAWREAHRRASPDKNKNKEAGRMAQGT